MHFKLSSICKNLLLSFFCFLAACGQPDDDYFPLDEGKYWRYQMTYQTMDGTFKGVYAVENMGAQQDGEQITHVRRLLDGSYNYFQIDDHGIKLTGREKTVDLNTQHTDTSRYVLRFPLQVGTEWEEIIMPKVLIKTGPPQKTEFHIVARIPVKVRIESMTDTVKVPAGTFKNCMQVTLSGDMFKDVGNYVGHTVVRVSETNWYAPGIGLIKSVRKESTKHKALDKGEIILELESYKG